MDPGYRIDVPPGFDDSDEEGQVHPIARRLFRAWTAAEVFEKAQRWVGEHQVFIADVSWKWAYDESEPFMLSVYFTFERDSEAADEDEGESVETAPAEDGPAGA